MVADPRDKIWELSYATYYESYFQEICADKLINLWQTTDDATKVLVSVTATGSAVAGWALWQDPGLKLIWVAIAGGSALLAIVHASLAVPNRVKDWVEIKRSFVSLRVRIETYRQRMEIAGEFPIESYLKEYEQFRSEYGELIPRLKNDLLRTANLANAAQEELDRMLDVGERHD